MFYIMELFWTTRDAASIGPSVRASAGRRWVNFPSGGEMVNEGTF